MKKDKILIRLLLLSAIDIYANREIRQDIRRRSFVYELIVGTAFTVLVIQTVSNITCVPDIHLQHLYQYLLDEQQRSKYEQY